MGIRFLWDFAVLGVLSTIVISRLKINSFHTTERCSASNRFPGMDVLIKEIKGILLETLETILSKCTNWHNHTQCKRAIIIESKELSQSD